MQALTHQAGTWKWGKTKEDLINELAAEYAKMPGFNVAFSQFIKTEFDYIKHWNLGKKNFGLGQKILGFLTKQDSLPTRSPKGP